MNAKPLSTFGAILVLSIAPLASTSAADSQVAVLEHKLSSLVASQDYLHASAAALRLARARNELGETAAACSALSQSLEYYRQGIMQEVGENEVARSSVEDHSDGMSAVRAQFGCESSRIAKQL